MVKQFPYDITQQSFERWFEGCESKSFMPGNVISQWLTSTTGQICMVKEFELIIVREYEDLRISIPHWLIGFRSRLKNLDQNKALSRDELSTVLRNVRTF